MRSPSPHPTLSLRFSAASLVSGAGTGTGATFFLVYELFRYLFRRQKLKKRRNRAGRRGGEVENSTIVLLRTRALLYMTDYVRSNQVGIVEVQICEKGYRDGVK